MCVVFAFVFVFIFHAQIRVQISQLQSLQDSLSTEKSTNHVLKQQRKGLKDAITKLKSELAESQAQLQLLKQETIEQAQAVTYLNTQLEGKRDQCAELKRVLNAAQQGTEGHANAITYGSPSKSSSISNEEMSHLRGGKNATILSSLHVNIRSLGSITPRTSNFIILCEYKHIIFMFSLLFFLVFLLVIFISLFVHVHLFNVFERVCRT